MHQNQHELSIQTLAFGGIGLGKDNNMVVFVPNTLPDEQILYTVHKKHKNYLEGRVTDWKIKSPLRISPKCQYFGTCGGCQLQNLPYEQQLLWKKSWIEEHFKKIGKIEIHLDPVFGCQSIWNYRKSIDLTIQDGCFGFTDINGNFLPINSCSIFQDHTLLYSNLKTFLNDYTNAKGRVKLYRLAEDKFCAYFDWKYFPYKGISLDQICQRLNLEGIRWKHLNVSTEFGLNETQTEIDDLKISHPIGSFQQNHPEGMLKMYGQLSQWLEKLPPQNVLELFCGVGALSLIAAKNNHQTTGIELDDLAVRYAIKNAKNNHLKAFFIPSDIYKNSANLLKKHPCETLIVNPPRKGLEKQLVDNICAEKIKNIMYLSCHPATMARDIEGFIKQGFNIVDMKAFDCFPQTTHVELAVYLSR